MRTEYTRGGISWICEYSSLHSDLSNSELLSSLHFFRIDSHDVRHSLTRFEERSGGTRSAIARKLDFVISKIECCPLRISSNISIIVGGSVNSLNHQNVHPRRNVKKKLIVNLHCHPDSTHRRAQAKIRTVGQVCTNEVLGSSRKVQVQSSNFCEPDLEVMRLTKVSIAYSERSLRHLTLPSVYR